MSLRGCRTILVLLVALALGCYRFPSAEERAASFQSLASTRVNNVPIQDFVEKRTAHLINVDSLQTSTDREGHVYLKSIRITGAATAVAIAHDGYLLTAAHCASTPVVAVLPARENEPNFARARIVYLGKARTLDQDIAIIKVDRQLPEIFEFASDLEVRANTPVLIAGHDMVGRRIGFTFAAGHILPLIEPSDFLAPHLTPVLHTTPLKPGDSGGPLLTPAGKLVAINIATATLRDRNDERTGISLRPNPLWIQSLLQADRKQHATLASKN